MKHFKDIFRTIFLFLAILFCGTEAKGEQSAPTLKTDSVEVSLLTCSPHEEIYSLYGHSALRWHDLRTGSDIVFNWGMFNFQAPHFVARFIFGLTDYELGIGDFRAFCGYYRRWGSSVTEQILNLTDEEKLRLYDALRRNLLPENKVYRYNFFYDNCSTRPRDIISQCINGKIIYAERTDYAPTFREMIHEKVKHHAWAQFGNDMLLGVRADIKTSRTEQEFLPENLQYDFDHAQIHANDGSYRPLVSGRNMAVEAGVQIRESDFPLTPTECFTILLVISIVIFAFEIHRKKTYKYWDIALMTSVGLAGCIILVMFFSQHPTTSTNLQILLLNPLPFLFLRPVFRRRKCRWWNIQLILIIIFFIGGLLQNYAEGMNILALCLLLRYWTNYKYAE